jgi:hypothetical protein
VTTVEIGDNLALVLIVVGIAFAVVLGTRRR